MTRDQRGKLAEANLKACLEGPAGLVKAGDFRPSREPKKIQFKPVQEISAAVQIMPKPSLPQIGLTITRQTLQTKGKTIIVERVRARKQPAIASDKGKATANPGEPSDRLK